jgi:type I restriction-modification system DNA methylase subunit
LQFILWIIRKTINTNGAFNRADGFVFSTSTDIDVALDPELLGKVFENLLATYNPETGGQARKATGSFYTPREIVFYFV